LRATPFASASQTIPHGGALPYFNNSFLSSCKFYFTSGKNNYKFTFCKIIVTYCQEDFMNLKKILLVEDNPINQAGQAAIFREAGYAVQVASNGHQALELFAKEQFQLVFVDIGLPDMKGTELVKWLRAMEVEELRKTALIYIMSAYTKKKMKDKYLAAGADKVLEKPITKIVLKTKLHKLAALSEKNLLEQNPSINTVNFAVLVAKIREFWRQPVVVAHLQ
jgi:CheY-like chemotaxis protein